MTSASRFTTTPDGAKLAYEIFGSEWIGRTIPVVLIGGMTSLRGDWERMVMPLAAHRPVLIYDHRGMGDSTYASPNRDDDYTIEVLARDLLALLSSLKWKEVALCGFSMGGVVVQQLLLLPYHSTRPTPLPFRVSHVVLSATLCATIWDRRYGLRIAPPDKSAHRPRTNEEKKARAKPIFDSTFDPEWIADPANKERYEYLLETMIHGRPTDTLSKQGAALRKFDFRGHHDKISRNMKVLVIHGQKDSIVPYSAGQELLERIPWATTPEVGTHPGQIPTLAFGHQWFEYFDAKVWEEVLERFLNNILEPPRLRASL